MEINIKLMSEVAYITLQKNPEDVYNNLKKNPTDSLWLRQYLGFEPFEEKEYSIEDFDLKDSSDSIDMSLDNGICIYEHLKHLPRYILCNPRFWAWITFEKAYKVAQNYSKSMGVDYITSSWLITDSRRALMLGVISHLFFMVQMSVEENKPNKYSLTKYLFSNPETYRNFCYRNIGMLRNVTLAVIRAQKDIWEKFNISILSKQNAEMIKETSKIGSVMLIDIMTEEEIYELIYPKFIKILTGR